MPLGSHAGYDPATGRGNFGQVRAAAWRPERVRSRQNRDTVVVYALLVALLLITAACGQVGVGSATNLLFIVGSLAIAYRAYRVGGLPLHAEVVIVLFVFAPLLRRMIDVKVGYDPSGTILIGPLAAVCVAFFELRVLLWARTRSFSVFIPYMLMAACVIYGWMLSAFQGMFLPSSIQAVKYMVPPLYCMCLILRPEKSSDVLRSVARSFLAVSPIIGIYGVWQHLDPQPWDQYWMIASKIPSIGKPYSGMVRVFSTMNSPVSFAAYATCGLLLFSFSPRTFIPFILVPFVAILPLCLAILLSAVRTAWISAAVSLLFCLLFSRTRGRASILIVCLGVGVAGAVTLTSFGDTVSARLETMQNGVSDDGSGGERISDYTHVFSSDGRYVLGTGLAPLEPDPVLYAMDGQILLSSAQMGTTIGVIYVLCVIWAGVQAVWRLKRDEGPLRLVAGALIVGNLAILPLTAIAVGEIGFLFWLLVGVLTVPEVTRSQWNAGTSNRNFPGRPERLKYD